MYTTLVPSTAPITPITKPTSSSVHRQAMPQIAARRREETVAMTVSDFKATRRRGLRRRALSTLLCQREKKPVLSPANIRGKPHMIEKAVASRDPVASASCVR